MPKPISMPVPLSHDRVTLSPTEFKKTLMELDLAGDLNISFPGCNVVRIEYSTGEAFEIEAISRPINGGHVEALQFSKVRK